MRKGKLIIKYEWDEQEDVGYSLKQKGDARPISAILVEILLENAIKSGMSKTEFINKIKLSWDAIKEEM